MGEAPDGGWGGGGGIRGKLNDIYPTKVASKIYLVMHVKEKSLPVSKHHFFMISVEDTISLHVK
jgi:hypothetical protein